MIHDPCKGAESNNANDDSQPNATEGDMMQHTNSGSDNNTENTITESFTADEESLYNTRYTEGYNLNDPKYISWLEVNHLDIDYEQFFPMIEHFPDVSVLHETPIELESDN